MSIDVYRGLVMFLLVPNPYSAFGVKQMAEANPSVAFWQWADRIFSHVPWIGMSVWDMVMPSFILLMGASMALSWDAHTARGEPKRQIIVHALLRAVAFVVLGLTLSIKPTTLLQEAWPIVFVLAWSAPHLLGAVLRSDRSAGVGRSGESNWWWAALIVAGAWHLTSHLQNPGVHHVGGVLVQAGLACIPACLLLERTRGARLGAALLILVAYWAAFMLYPAAVDRQGAASLLQRSTFDGHWVQNANLASAFDRWFFNLFPRTEPFELHAHGYQTLNFVPTVSSLLFGMVAGQTIVAAATPVEARNRLVRDGALLLFAGLLAALTVCPLIKSLWTPSWTLASSGISMIALAVIHHACDVKGWRGWGTWFVVLGSNSILMYVLSYYPWRIVQPWRRLFGDSLASDRWTPLVESAIVLTTLLLLAAVLHRYRVRLRL